MNKGTLLIISNPCAGKGLAKKITPKVEKILQNAGYLVNTLYTEKRGDAATFASVMGYNTIVAIGGDGTLNETISGIVGTGLSDVTLGYIPLGSTNDFGRSIGISKNWKKAVDVIVNGEPQLLDVCKFNDKFFAYVAAHGIFAKTSCAVSQKLKNKVGRLAYFLLGVKEVFQKVNYPIKIEIDGRLIEDTYAFLGFGNTRSIGGILKFKDSVANLTDGSFEVLLVKYPKNLWQLSRMLKKFNKSEWQGDGLELYHAKTAKIYPKDRMLWSLDGEKLIVEEESEVSIVPSAIRLLVEK